jgi:hypothetical protein
MQTLIHWRRILLYNSFLRLAESKVRTDTCLRLVKVTHTAYTDVVKDKKHSAAVEHMLAIRVRRNLAASVVAQLCARACRGTSLRTAENGVIKARETRACARALRVWGRYVQRRGQVRLSAELARKKRMIGAINAYRRGVTYMLYLEFAYMRTHLDVCIRTRVTCIRAWRNLTEAHKILYDILQTSEDSYLRALQRRVVQSWLGQAGSQKNFRRVEGRILDGKDVWDVRKAFKQWYRWLWACWREKVCMYVCMCA